MFPSVPLERGHYESYYLRAVAPDRPAAVWIRYTVHKRPGAEAWGSLWCTLWDGASPRAIKQTISGPRFDGGGIEIGAARLGPAGAVGGARADGREAAWELRHDEGAGIVQHLPWRWLYRAPIPRTKTASLVSNARFSGSVELDGHLLKVEGWRGMVGHNWGTEHAERWIWLHAVDFEAAADAWLDCALGRVQVAGRTTPWIANGVLSLGGELIRLGGLGRRTTRVSEEPTAAKVSVPSSIGTVELDVSSPPGQTVAWVYADPSGREHHSLHCSVAAMNARVGDRVLQTPHGGCYELGVRERDHGIAVQPFGDG